MKKRTALVAATLSAAMTFGTAPALAETATDTSSSTATAPTATPTAAPTSTPATPADEAKPKESDKAKESTTPTGSTTTTPDPNALDPNVSIWDKNGASSESGKQGSFGGSSGLNRLENYVNSNQFKTISIIMSAIGAVLTVGTQLGAIAVTVSPAAKAQFEAFLKQFS